MAVAVMLKTIFAQETKADAETQWQVVADSLREKQPKLGALIDASRDTCWPTVLPARALGANRKRNPLETSTARSNAADVIGIFPNDDAIVCLVGALML